MAGFIPAIHVFSAAMRSQDVDARDKPAETAAKPDAPKPDAAKADAAKDSKMAPAKK